MSSAYVAVAKFQVTSVEHHGYRNHEGTPTTSAVIVKMAPVYAPKDDPENENWKFTNATPSGSFEMRVENPDLFKSFSVGQVFYLPLINADQASLQAVSEALGQLRGKAMSGGG